MPGDPISEDPHGRSVGAEATGVLAQVTARLPGGHPRPQQIDMCARIAAALDDGRHLVVQAGTGTGKSLAYLVPAGLSERRVVVATATKALQDQLATKDLPLVASTLDHSFSFAVLKGRNNYLCRQRAREMTERGMQSSFDDTERADPDREDVTPDPGEDAAAPERVGGPERVVDQVRSVLEWAQESTTGDRADLAFEPHPRAWAMLSVGPRECPGAFRCPSGSDCFAEAARAAADAADVVVVNTHLYGAHVASGGAVLPEHDVVIFDEAHELEEVMTASLGVEISPGRLRALVALVRPLLDDPEALSVLDDLADTAGSLADVLGDRLGERVLREAAGPENRRGPADPGVPDGRERRRGPPPGAVGDGGGDPAGLGGDQHLARLLELVAARLPRLVGALRRLDDEPTFEGIGGGHSGRRARALSAAGHLATDLDRVAARTSDEVAWIDGNRRAPVLRLSPIDVGPALAGALWGEVTAVLTSATVPLRLSERLGLADFAHDELDVGSPFDYRTHALLYVARHLPDRRRPEAEPAIHRELEALIEAAGGRTLALFTSHRATESAAAALGSRLPYRILVQGELPKGRLLAAFSDDEPSCLFATLGFWQGVDVPGRALSLVTLDRLPFPRPDDPLLEARRERAGTAAFRVVDLPRAATLLAQGAGRLIRSAEDRGVVAVLDPRLATAGYRGVLLAGMPPMRRTTDRHQVEDFFTRILSGA